MLLSVSLLVLLLATAVIYLWRQPRQGGPRASSESANLDGSGRFHALSIRFGAGACEQSRQLHGQRFLAGNVPELPLADCNVDNCQCRFVHHGDRRQGDDRRSPFQGGFGGSAPRRDDDRRHSSDRRNGQSPSPTDS